MANAQRRALVNYRLRLKRRGMVRLEVRVRKDDVSLVRNVVSALDDPDRAGEARAVLRGRFGAGKASGLKELLASVPLEGVGLDRDLDLGRDMEL